MICRFRREGRRNLPLRSSVSARRSLFWGIESSRVYESLLALAGRKVDEAPSVLNRTRMPLVREATTRATASYHCLPTLPPLGNQICTVTPTSPRRLERSAALTSGNSMSALITVKRANCTNGRPGFQPMGRAQRCVPYGALNFSSVPADPRNGEGKAPIGCAARG